jgi:hypothetical protein
MKLVVFPKLQTQSRRALLKTKGKYGRPHHYQPRIDLLFRLQKELGMSVGDLLDQIDREREYLIKHLF